jgi:hypothetical protein
MFASRTAAVVCLLVAVVEVGGCCGSGSASPSTAASQAAPVQQALRADHAASNVQIVGHEHLVQAPQPNWTPADLLQALAVSVGRPLPASTL